MKTLLIASLLCALTTGCTESLATKTPDAPAKVVEENGVNLDIPVKFIAYDLDHEYQYQLVEKYGAITYKALYLCSEKHDSMIKNIDSSSDYGAAVLNDYFLLVEECMVNSLSSQKEIPENRRIKLTNVEEEEYDSFDPVSGAPSDVDFSEIVEK